MFGELAMYVLSGLLLVLGGISLLTQKVYRQESSAGVRVEVELPFFGKMTTNYPALVFAFIGAGIAVFTFDRSFDQEVTWLIAGQFEAPESTDSEPFGLGGGYLNLAPRKYQATVQPNGRFEVQASIERGLDFEDEIKSISFNRSCGGVLCFGDIETVDAYERFQRGDKSTLKSVGERTRIYSPVKIEVTRLVE